MRTRLEVAVLMVTLVSCPLLRKRMAPPEPCKRENRIGKRQLQEECLHVLAEITEAHIGLHAVKCSVGDRAGSVDVAASSVAALQSAASGAAGEQTLRARHDGGVSPPGLPRRVT